VPVVTGFTAAGLQGVQFVPFGVQLTFTPYLTDRDRVRLAVSADVSSRDLSVAQTTIAGANVPNLITRNFMTTVELREGQTLAVAGLIQNTLGADSERVPLFGDLPLIGPLTGYSKISAGEQELVILITPELVHPLEGKEVGALPGSDLFEPDDCEFYLLGRIEGRNGVDYRSPVRSDIHRILHFKKCEKQYLIGPAGHCPLQ
jgi:pilus assembly protein CpaC